MSKFEVGHIGYWKGKKMSKEHADKVSIARKGKVNSPYTRQKISEALKKFYANGGEPTRGMLGKRHTEEMKQKMSQHFTGLIRQRFGEYKSCEICKKIYYIKNCQAKLRRTCSRKCAAILNSQKIGENSNNWKGGVTKEKGYAQSLTRQRKVWKLGNGGTHTLADWEQLKMQFNYMCLCCKKCEPEITLSEDHIIPLSKGGSDDISNIQPLCRSCNSIKRTKTTDYRLVLTNQNETA